MNTSLQGATYLKRLPPLLPANLQARGLERSDEEALMYHPYTD